MGEFNIQSAIAIRHVHFEDLGTFQEVLTSAQYEVTYVDVGVHDLSLLDPLAPELMIVLGAPVGAYEIAAYPFLLQERDLLKRRLAAGLPTVGICLGAQMIAASLGASVVPGRVKEIGYAPVSLTASGKSSVLRHLDGVPVLHWHGDVLDLPPDATCLAFTEPCSHQAFSIGANVLGLQFHPEVDSSKIEAWLIGHASELASAGIDPRQIRRDAAAHGDSLSECSRAMFKEWLENI